MGAMKATTNNISFYDAYQWLKAHPAFYFKGPCVKDVTDKESLEGLIEALTIDVVKVNPATKRIEDDIALNTEVVIWLECGPWDKTIGDWPSSFCYTGIPTHDINLDCSGPTFEAAIIALYWKVLEHYGDYEH